MRGARFVPDAAEGEGALGSEPDGGVRSLSAGVRSVRLPSGAVRTAEDRLPRQPQVTLALPERLGGGFLFLLGGNGAASTVWRAEQWLGEARPVFQSTSPLATMFAGLDRVYLKSSTGAYAAIDGKSGARLDLGPFPQSSFVGAFVAADGWRAVAVNDLRGAVATFDAGATWRPLALPLSAKKAALSGDAIAVGGTDPSHEELWFEVRADGQVARLSGPPPKAGKRTDEGDSESGSRQPLGRRPLRVAVEDGWPLTDGTVLIAREGSLYRVALADGAILEVVDDAFPLATARCHPIAMPRDDARGAFGFVCGEVRGPTVVYGYDVGRGALSPRIRFERPRQVLSFGNGALAIRGSCASSADDSGVPLRTTAEKTDDRPPAREFCVVPRQGAPYTLPLTGMEPDDRLVVLADGTIAVLSVPHGDLSTARLTVRRGDVQSTVGLSFHAKAADPKAPLAPDVMRALRLGVWLDGWEERRPGVLGGWVDTGTGVVGLEIALNGTATHGPYIHDGGAPVVSGRYALGWTPSRRGVESVDGGMTFTPVELPDALSPAHAIATRACGPVGCSAAGWLRIGWGAPAARPVPDPPPPQRPPALRGTEPLRLACTPVAPLPPAAPEARHAQASDAPVLPRPRAGISSPWGSVVSVLGSSSSGMDLPPFYVSPAPLLHPDERGITAEASERIERSPRTGPLARIYAWGPKTGEWEQASRWLVRWVSPFGGWQDVHASLATPPPAFLVEAARFASPGSGPLAATWALGVSDDGAHALLAARHSTPRGLESVLFELEEGRAPVEIRRADGEPMGELESATRAAGRWYVLAAPTVGDWSSVVWEVDGRSARELARVPRAGMDARPMGARLARRSDGRALGIVVDGQPSFDRSGAQRWVLPIDMETGALGEPEPLGAQDLGDRGKIPLCTDDDAGWVLDAAWSTGVRLTLKAAPGAGEKPLATTDARVRLTSTSACVERLAGTLGALEAEQVGSLAQAGGGRQSERSGIPVVVISAASRTSQMRYPLRCTTR